MLYKVFMTDYFREDPDTVGIVEADDVAAAVDKVQTLTVESFPWDFEFSPEIAIDQGGRGATLRMTSTDEEGVTGTDVYRVEYQATEIWMFHAQEWEKLFRS